MALIRTDRLKLGGSLLLLICLTLPMAECSIKQAHEEPAPAPSTTDRDGGQPDARSVSQPEPQPLYVVELSLVDLDEALSSGNVARAAPFVFPALLRLYQVRCTKRRRRAAAYLLEVATVLVAGYVVALFFIIFDPLIGAYLGALAVVLYAAAWVLDADTAWTAWRTRIAGSSRSPG